MCKKWIFDIECYPNLFLICAKNTETKEIKRFQISPLKDDRNKLSNWLQNEVDEMIGFNNLFYDYPVLHHALNNLWNNRGKDFCFKLFKFSDELIKGKKNYIKENEFYKKQIDLFKINHYDNKARMTSLKSLQFNFKMTNLQELPYKPGTLLTLDEIQNVIDYCDNDVNATEILYQNTLSEITLREKMSPIYNIDFTNYNSTKMGEYILISKIIESLGKDAVYDYIETDYGIKQIVKQTINKEIDLSKIVFDYISFTTKPFQNILKWFKSKTITETNGVFNEIPFNELLLLENNYVIKKKNGKQETLNVLYKNFQYDFGVGGLHGSIKSGIYEADNDYHIYDWDVTSFYPKLAIVNKFYPLHYGEVFCDIYEKLFLEREQYDKKTHYSENLAIKLALNGSYGKSNSSYSALYDSSYTMKTTINGQLLLCMLCERLCEEIPDIQMLQVNTDGISFKIHKKYTEQMYSICKRWEIFTKLNLENVQYSKMIISNVNNYIAIKTDGTIKRKGASFIYKIAPGELEWHKNFSALVVPKALEQYFVNDIPVEKFIYNHNDVYDFFKRTKINKTDKLLLRNDCGDTEIQRVSRYYISGKTKYNKESKNFESVGSGYSLIKEMPPLLQKETKKLKSDYEKLIKNGYLESYETYKKSLIKNRNTNLEANYLCNVVNDLSKTNDKEIKQNIYYQYYIDECYKIIDIIKNKN